jgi:(p)ppGpp synthase/HD superfamily hydrolase
MRSTETRKAATLAALLHHGQVDKGGQPILHHVHRVAWSLDFYGARTLAYLHDVVEDTHCTLDDLRSLGFSKDIVDAVSALTRREGEVYGRYIERVATYDGPLASFVRDVKLADLADHLAGLRRGNISPSMVRKYERAVARLNEAINAEVDR